MWEYLTWDNALFCRTQKEWIVFLYTEHKLKNKEVIIVDDVDAFPEHIACSSLSKSEIVLPIYNSKQEIIGVLDVDSDAYATFDKTDELYLNQILKLIGE